MAAARNILMLGLFVGLWLLWSGHFEPMPLVFGALSCVFAVWLAARMQVNDEEGYPLWLLPRFLFGYLPWLLWQIVLSNLSVARLILDPRLPIAPRVVLLKSTQKSAIGQVILANSITITPGTISLDVRDGQLMIHALTAAAAAEDGTGEMDRRVTWVEGKG